MNGHGVVSYLYIYSHLSENWKPCKIFEESSDILRYMTFRQPLKELILRDFRGKLLCCIIKLSSLYDSYRYILYSDQACE